MLFNAVVMNFAISIFFKILSIMQSAIYIQNLRNSEKRLVTPPISMAVGKSVVEVVDKVFPPSPIADYISWNFRNSGYWVRQWQGAAAI